MKLMSMWGSLQNEYAVLSTIPTDINSVINDKKPDMVPHMCSFDWSEK
jgi:hypothetical protein